WRSRMDPAETAAAKEKKADPWTRVNELADELEGKSPEEIHARQLELRQAGEPLEVLSLLGRWLVLPPLPSPPGEGDTLVGRFTLTRKLGQGGMGSVWEATQSRIARNVAVKLIHPALVSPFLERQFLSEMKILGKLEHPGIVGIFDADIHDLGAGR